jgi:hypothetical protein
MWWLLTMWRCEANCLVMHCTISNWLVRPLEYPPPTWDIYLMPLFILTSIFQRFFHLKKMGECAKNWVTSSLSHGYVAASDWSMSVLKFPMELNLCVFSLGMVTRFLVGSSSYRWWYLMSSKLCIVDVSDFLQFLRCLVRFPHRFQVELSGGWKCIELVDMKPNGTIIPLS